MPRAVQLRNRLTPEAEAIERVLSVKHKLTGEIIPYKLNHVQRRYDMQWTGRDKFMNERPTRDIINKARQQGISAYVTAVILVKALFRAYFRAIILTHVASSSEVLLEKIRFYLQNPQETISDFDITEEETAVDNRKVIRLQNGSSIVITTANNKNTAVGDTADAIHASEVAKWRKSSVQGLKTGLLQTLPPTGHLWYESTGDGIDNYFYDITMHAWRDETGESIHSQNFFSWVESPEYQEVFETLDARNNFMASLRDDLEEPEVIRIAAQAGYGEVTAEQLKWRRAKLLSDFIEDGVPNLKLFKQEYPLTLLECFQSSVHSLFQKFNWIENDERWKFDVVSGAWKLAGHPREQYTYISGADISAGIGKNYTVLDIWCVDTQEQVLQHRTNKLDPVSAAHTHARLMYPYRAYHVPEINNHGLTYCVALQDVWPMDLLFCEDRQETRDESDIHITGMGFKTTTGKKPKWIGFLSSFFSYMDFRIYSKFTAMELHSFTETDSGKLEGDNESNDDTVMAAMLCYIGMHHLDMVPEKFYTHYFENAIISRDVYRGNSGLDVLNAVKDNMDEDQIFSENAIEIIPEGVLEEFDLTTGAP